MIEYVFRDPYSTELYQESSLKEDRYNLPLHRNLRLSRNLLLVVRPRIPVAQDETAYAPLAAKRPSANGPESLCASTYERVVSDHPIVPQTSGRTKPSHPLWHTRL